MKAFKDYENTQVINTQERLPIGGYVLEIKGVEIVTTDYGERLILSFDVAEGDYKGYYAENYRNQTGEDKRWKGTYRISIPKDDGSEEDAKTKRIFKTNIAIIEESNNGFHWDWDETKLKNKKVGGVFRNKEYSINGNRGFYTECAWLTTVEKIKEGKFKVPADKLLDSKSNVSASTFNPQSPDVLPDDDLPF